MDIYFASMTGNVRTLVSRLPFTSYDIADNPMASNDFVLITYTTGIGQVPPAVSEWLKTNHSYMKGVIVSGNRNWGEMYGKAGHIISEQYRVPLLHKLELFGKQSDYDEITRRVSTL